VDPVDNPARRQDLLTVLANPLANNDNIRSKARLSLPAAATVQLS